MVKPDKNSDQFFKDLFRQGGIDKAPEGFTDRVMKAIEAETDLVADEGSIFSRNNWWMWASIFIALGGLISVIFFVDFSFMGGIFNGIELDGSRIATFIQYLGDGLITTFEGFRVSSTSVIIVLSIVALVLADYFLRRRPKMGMNMV